MLPRSERLAAAIFAQTFADSTLVRHPLLVGRARRRADGDGQTRAAFVVPKKQGTHAKRNRTRRRLRERYRLHARRGEPAGCDLIFMATPQTAEASNEQLDAALDDVLRRLSRKIGPPRDELSRPVAPTTENA